MSPIGNDNGMTGRAYWRSLDQLADTPEFKEFLHREFPQGASELTDPLTRRNFLTLMGASLALAGLAGCRRPVEKILPYVIPPEDLVPGIPQYYATTMSVGTHAYGLLVESHEGRPTKIEGNKLHPSTLGKTNALLQASILNLYDPDRSASLLNDGGERTWDEFVVHWQEKLAHFKETQGAGLAILSEAFASPTLAALKTEFERTFPQARWVAYEPISEENIDEGIRITTGQSLRPLPHYELAKTILALDSDFLLTESEDISATRGYAAGRRMDAATDEMNRLYVAEGGFSLTGSLADHRLRVKNSAIGAFAAALAQKLSARGVSLPIENFAAAGGQSFDEKWLNAVADDLVEHRGECLVVTGQHQPAVVHALVFAINSALGNVGKTIEYCELTDVAQSRRAELKTLIDDMRAGSVETLFVLGGNPLYDTPGDSRFAAAFAKVPETIHLSSHIDETSRKSKWHLPRAHSLESWGDARAADGTLSIVQPLISPLFDGHSDIEVANLLVSGRDRRGYELVRETWKKFLPTLDYEKKWDRVLHDGLLAESALPKVQPKTDASAIGKALAAASLNASSGNGLEVRFMASPKVHDGRFANNGWLQELPETVTKICWDNAAIISTGTAEKLGLKSQDVVRLSSGERSIEIPAWVQPGHADDAVTIWLGHGRTSAGRVGNNVGVNAFELVSLMTPDILLGATMTPTLRTHVLANTQDHGSMEGRPIVREATIDEFRKEPNFAEEMVEHPPLKSLWQEHDYSEGYQWGMSIDLNSCTGCNACTIACQSENNIPIVGAEQVHNGREMHWIRIDRYYTGDMENPEVVHQPVACQHCENAPCEQVCPVAATMHSEEGLNTMVYNRCIGTRYCSNNCPYKVRRFNFFNYTKDTPELVKMAMNPNVTMRFRGVMEKCTYCVQRISRARIGAKDDNREIKDGEVVAACQQACPADAIVFGNINDPDSKVSQMKKRDRRYELLAELNVKPRTSFRAKLRNPNPKLV